MDLPSILMLAVLAVLIVFMFRNSRKRKAQAEDLRAQIVPGAEIMTNFGLYGTLISLDDITKVAEVETSPGNIVRVHSQTIAKVVTGDDGDEPRSVEEAMERANREAAAKDDAIDSAEPEFGVRVDEDSSNVSTASDKAKTDKAND